MSKSLDVRARNREHDSRRGSARQRGYGRRWEKARADFLQDNPLCVMCLKGGLINPGIYRLDGSVDPNPRRQQLRCDHITPHRGDMVLFWDRANWQPLCPDHHDIIKQREEHGRARRALDADGWPLDPAS